MASLSMLQHQFTGVWTVSPASGLNRVCLIKSKQLFCIDYYIYLPMLLLINMCSLKYVPEHEISGLIECV